MRIDMPMRSTSVLIGIVYVGRVSPWNVIKVYTLTKRSFYLIFSKEI